ncbi:MAG: type VI secretion system ATPase TssH, partial [Anaerolineae bacterium]|nr:type VI secretion system ATPase TssH [Anaerolineae bacterium]
MRQDKFTQRAQEALVEAQSQAEAYNHAQIEPEHLLLALLTQPEGVVPQIVLGLGTNPQQLAAQAEAVLNSRPKVYGDSVQPGVSGALQRVLQAAQREADSMRDDYVSAEHLFLALADKAGNGVQKLLAAAG